MKWYTLHVSSYGKALCIITIGDWKIQREQRGIFKVFSGLFSMLQIENLQSHFVLQYNSFCYRN